MRFARWVFLVAGIYGILITTPMFFLERRIGHETAPITHPEYFYGFASLVIAWQLMFLLIAGDPKRYRPAMPIGIIEKFSFAIPVPILFAMGRVPANILVFAMIDAVLALLFGIAYVKTRPAADADPARQPRAELKTVR
jgi:hypothetical protein